MVPDHDDGDARTVQMPMTESASGDARPGELLPRATRYRIVERLARGGMGEVLLAYDELVGRDVVVKRMLDPHPSSAAVERFLREARLQGRLDHPAIVPVHEIAVEDSGTPYFVMKRLNGTTLARIIKHKDDRFTQRRLLRAFADVCLAVEYAHVRGIVHRDIKPANIMLGDFGEVWLLDWGVAKLVGDVDTPHPLASGTQSGDRGDAASTHVGDAIGTPGYMAPEQARGEADIDARADTYALGCVLFEILTATPLYDKGGDPKAFVPRSIRPSAAAPDRAIAPELDTLCLQAIAVARSSRPSARELGDAVQRFLDGDRDTETRRALAVEHLRAAHAAFVAGDSAEHRSEAIREAGRAVALEPALPGAAGLVARLMLEPPRTAPPEVYAEVAAENQRATQDTARVAGWVYVSFIAIVPLLWWIAPRGSPWIGILSALIAVGAGCAWLAQRNATPARAVLMLAANVAIIAVVARMYTPFLIAPGLAAAMTFAFVITPIDRRFPSSILLPLAMCASTVGMWLLELTGTLSTTTRISPDGIILNAAAVAGQELPTLVVSSLYTVALLAGIAVLGTAIRNREDALKQRLHLQAWQLRQLVAQ